MAEELLQETYLRGWKSLDKLRDSDAAKSWLFTIFRREYARQFERSRLETEDIEAWPSLASKPAYDTSVEAFSLRRALNDLAFDYREPFVLQVLGGFTCAEIANIMGISKAAVLTRLFRARKKLSSALLDVPQQRVNRS